MHSKEYPPLLTDAETRSLVARMRDAGKTEATRKAAREKLITHNLRLVAKVVNRLTSHLSSREDAFQAGCVGLVLAAEKVDPERAGGWYSIASLEVTHEVAKWVREHGGQVKFSNRMGPRANQIRKTIAALENANRAVSVEAVATELELTIEQVAVLWPWVVPGGLISLNHESGEGAAASEWVADKTPSPEAQVVKAAMETAAIRALATLPTVERVVVSKVFGFTGETPAEPAEIDSGMGWPKGTAASHLAAGLARMREAVGGDEA